MKFDTIKAMSGQTTYTLSNEPQLVRLKILDGDGDVQEETWFPQEMLVEFARQYLKEQAAEGECKQARAAVAELRSTEEQVRDVYADYEKALANREHGDLAADRVVKSLRKIVKDKE